MGVAVARRSSGRPRLRGVWMSAVDEPLNGLLRYRVDAIEKKVQGIEERIDRLIFAVVVAAFTLAGAVILLALNLIVLRKGG